MPATMTAPDLLADLTRRGFAVRVASGAIAVTPASALDAADRQAIRERRAELLVILLPGEVWDVGTASRLMFDADGLVEKLGVDGRHPAVADAAAMVCSAHLTHELETLRFAVSEFVAVVHRLAAVRPASKVISDRSG